jgi:hypothetical protein
MEQAIQFVGGDADAGVLDFEAYVAASSPWSCSSMATYRHLAAFGEFDRIAGVVEQRLAQAGRVAAQPHRHVAAIDLDAQALGLRRAGDHRMDMVKHAPRESSPVRGNLAGFDLRQVEDVVDDREQVSPGLANLVGRELGLEPVAVDLEVGHHLALGRIAWLAGDQHDLHQGVVQVMADVPHQVQAGPFGFHHHVQQDQRGIRVLRQQRFGFFAVAGVQQVQRAAHHLHVVQRQVQHGVDVGLVVNQHHLPRRPLGRQGSDRQFGCEQAGKRQVVIHRGTSMWNSAPSPSLLSHQMLPPKRWVTRL